MRSDFRHIIRTLAFAIALTLTVIADAAPTWEKVGTVAAELVDQSSTDNIEVKVTDGAIVITLSQPVNVKLFTILGQLVAEQKLEAGTWRLPLTSRGIYILKAGSATRRVTL